jgi:hypothetical protein
MDEWEDRQVGELNLDVRSPLAAQILHLIKKEINYYKTFHIAQ